MRRCASSTVRRVASVGWAVSTSSTRIRSRLPAGRPGDACALELAERVGERLPRHAALVLVLAPAPDPMVLLGDVGELEEERERAEHGRLLLEAELRDRLPERLPRAAGARIAGERPDPLLAVEQLLALLLDEDPPEQVAEQADVRAESAVCGHAASLERNGVQSTRVASLMSAGERQPGQRHRQVELGLEVAQHLDARRRPGEREPVDVRPADEDGGRAERDGLERHPRPLRMPLSSSTGTRPSTAATTPGSASSDAIEPSTCRPPWFDTTIPATPASRARRASSGCRIPLSRIGSRVSARSVGEVGPGQRRPRVDVEERLDGGAGGGGERRLSRNAPGWRRFEARRAPGAPRASARPARLVGRCARARRGCRKTRIATCTARSPSRPRRQVGRGRGRGAASRACVVSSVTTIASQPPASARRRGSSTSSSDVLQ